MSTAARAPGRGREDGLLRALWRERHRLPLRQALSTGLVCVLPVLAAALSRQPALGWAAIAAFWTCLQDQPERGVRARLALGLQFSGVGALATALAMAAHLLGGVPGAVPVLPAVLPAVLTALAVFVGAQLRRQGPQAGLRGQLLATACAVAGVLPAHELAAAPIFAAGFFLGGVWATLAGIGLLRQRPERRPGQAAAVFFAGAAAFSSMLAARAVGRRCWLPVGRAQLRARLDALVQAEQDAGLGPVWQEGATRCLALLAGLETLLQCAADSAGRRGAAAWLEAPLRQVAAMCDVQAAAGGSGAASLALLNARLERLLNACRSRFAVPGQDQVHDWGRACVAVLRRLGMTLSTLPSGPTPASAAPPVVPAVRLVSKAEPVAVPAAAPLPARPRRAWQAWRAAVQAGDPLARYAVRAAAAAALAVALVNHFALPQGNWLVLTVLFVMQPNVARTMQTARQRVGGTVLGALLATALGGLTHNKLLLAAAVLPLASATMIARGLSYLSFTLFLTPHFILVADMAAAGDATLPLAGWRVANSLGGVALGIVASLLFWPEWERQSVRRAAVAALDATLAYGAPVLRGGEHAALRRAACVAIDQLETQLARLRYEPWGTTRLRLAGQRLQALLRRLTGVLTLLEMGGEELSALERADLRALAGRLAAGLDDQAGGALRAQASGSYVVRAAAEALEDCLRTAALLAAELDTPAALADGLRTAGSHAAG